jgi:hypothetical protein
MKRVAGTQPISAMYLALYTALKTHIQSADFTALPIHCHPARKCELSTYFEYRVSLKQWDRICDRQDGEQRFLSFSTRQCPCQRSNGVNAFCKGSGPGPKSVITTRRGSDLVAVL